MGARASSRLRRLERRQEREKDVARRPRDARAERDPVARDRDRRSALLLIEGAEPESARGGIGDALGEHARGGERFGIGPEADPSIGEAVGVHVARGELEAGQHRRARSGDARFGGARERPRLVDGRRARRGALGRGVRRQRRPVRDGGVEVEALRVPRALGRGRRGEQTGEDDDDTTHGDHPMDLRKRKAANEKTKTPIAARTASCTRSSSAPAPRSSTPRRISA